MFVPVSTTVLDRSRVRDQNQNPPTQTAIPMTTNQSPVGCFWYRGVKSTVTSDRHVQIPTPDDTNTKREVTEDLHSSSTRLTPDSLDLPVGTHPSRTRDGVGGPRRDWVTEEVGGTSGPHQGCVWRTTRPAPIPFGTSDTRQSRPGVPNHRPSSWTDRPQPRRPRGLTQHTSTSGPKGKTRHPRHWS